MNMRKTIITLTLATLLSTAAISNVWAYSAGGNINQQHEFTRGGHTSVRHGLGGQMVPASPLLKSAVEQVNYARKNYNHMRSAGDPRRVTAARSMLTNAETMLATVMADMSGLTVSKVGEMRNSGLNWQQVGIRIGIDMAHLADWNGARHDEFHGQFMGDDSPASQYGYDYHVDMHGNDSLHSDRGSTDGYGSHGLTGHGGMMGGMH